MLKKGQKANELHLCFARLFQGKLAERMNNLVCLV